MWKGLLLQVLCGANPTEYIGGGEEVKYFIEFEVWVVEGKDEEAAWDKARSLLKEGYLPNAFNMERCEDQDAEVHNGEKGEVKG